MYLISTDFLLKMRYSLHMNKYAIGMVFGVFDGFHAGHQFFLTEAQKQCSKLIVVVTRSEMVQQLKGFTPQYTYEQRASAIQKYNQNLHIVPSDTVLGSWDVFKKQTPTIVFLGHDQQGIAKELKKIPIPYIYLPAHHPEKYKSSLLLKRT